MESYQHYCTVRCTYVYIEFSIHSIHVYTVYVPALGHVKDSSDHLESIQLDLFRRTRQQLRRNAEKTVQKMIFDFSTLGGKLRKFSNT